MATYNKEYLYTRFKRKKQKYSLITRVVDLAKAPITSGGSVYPEPGYGTTAWAAGDVLQLIPIRAGQTVLGVQFELIKKGTAGHSVDVGYGSDTDRWGRYLLRDQYDPDEKVSTGVVNSTTSGHQMPEPFFDPLYFSTADTIDVVINDVVTKGKFRLIVHLLEDDR